MEAILVTIVVFTVLAVWITLTTPTQEPGCKHANMNDSGRGAVHCLDCGEAFIRGHSEPVAEDEWWNAIK